MMSEIEHNVHKTKPKFNFFIFILIILERTNIWRKTTTDH